MKRLLLILAIVSLLLSCGDGETELYTVSITNNSSKSVSYTYNDISDTLTVSETKTYKVKAHTQPPKNIVDQNGVASLNFNKNGMTGNIIFFDADYYFLYVINKLPVDIIIKADNYIDNNGSTELFIQKDKESTAKIYTKSPKFTSTTNYPIIVEHTISGNEMSVIIR